MWGTFEVYVMAENDLALACLSLSLFSGKDGVEESQFRGNANCSERERETSWREFIAKGVV